MHVAETRQELEDVGGHTLGQGHSLVQGQGQDPDLDQAPDPVTLPTQALDLA